MKKEYELSKLKVKRRGPLPAFRDDAWRSRTAVAGEDLRLEQTEAIKEAPETSPHARKRAR